MKIYKVLIKITRDTNLFCRGQKVWLKYWLADRARVCGRLKKKGKWIECIIGIEGISAHNCSGKIIGEFELKGNLKRHFFLKKYGITGLPSRTIPFFYFREFVKTREKIKELEKKLGCEKSKVHTLKQEAIHRYISQMPVKKQSFRQLKKNMLKSEENRYFKRPLAFYGSPLLT